MSNTIQVALTMSDEMKLVMKDTVQQAMATYIPPLTTIEEEYLTPKEVAKALKITLPTVNSYSLKGLLKAYRLGRKVRYKKSELGLALTPFRL